MSYLQAIDFYMQQLNDEYIEEHCWVVLNTCVHFQIPLTGYVYVGLL